MYLLYACVVFMCATSFMNCAPRYLSEMRNGLDQIESVLQDEIPKNCIRYDYLSEDNKKPTEEGKSNIEESYKSQKTGGCKSQKTGGYKSDVENEFHKQPHHPNHNFYQSGINHEQYMYYGQARHENQDQLYDSNKNQVERKAHHRNQGNTASTNHKIYDDNQGYSDEKRFENKIERENNKSKEPNVLKSRRYENDGIEKTKANKQGVGNKNIENIYPENDHYYNNFDRNQHEYNTHDRNQHEYNTHDRNQHKFITHDGNQHKFNTRDRNEQGYNTRDRNEQGYNTRSGKNPSNNHRRHDSIISRGVSNNEYGHQHPNYHTNHRYNTFTKGDPAKKLIRNKNSNEKSASNLSNEFNTAVNDQQYHTIGSTRHRNNQNNRFTHSNHGNWKEYRVRGEHHVKNGRYNQHSGNVDYERNGFGYV